MSRLRMSPLYRLRRARAVPGRCFATPVAVDVAARVQLAELTPAIYTGRAGRGCRCGSS